MFYLFADDTNILYADKSLNVLEKIVNEELVNVYDWLTSNKLTLNIKKSNYVIFHPYQQKLYFEPKITIFDNTEKKQVALENKEFIKYLGVFIDKGLSWKEHINYILTKISRSVGLISKLRHFIPRHTLLTIYQALIVPYISYGLTVWGQTSSFLLNKILILQKRALRFIYSTKRDQHAIPLFIDAKVLPLQFMYFECISSLMYDVRNKVAPQNIQNLFSNVSDIHSYRTRSSTSNVFYIKSSRTDHLKNSFSRFGARVWNEIPNSFKELPKKAFKQKLHETLLKLLHQEDSYQEVSGILRKIGSMTNN